MPIVYDDQLYDQGNSNLTQINYQIESETVQQTLTQQQLLEQLESEKQGLLQQTRQHFQSVIDQIKKTQLTESQTLYDKFQAEKSQLQQTIQMQQEQLKQLEDKQQQTEKLILQQNEADQTELLRQQLEEQRIQFNQMFEQQKKQIEELKLTQTQQVDQLALKQQLETEYQQKLNEEKQKIIEESNKKLLYFQNQLQQEQQQVQKILQQRQQQYNNLEEIQEEDSYHEQQENADIKQQLPDKQQIQADSNVYSNTSVSDQNIDIQDQQDSQFLNEFRNCASAIEVSMNNQTQIQPHNDEAFISDSTMQSIQNNSIQQLSMHQAVQSQLIKHQEFPAVQHQAEQTQQQKLQCRVINDQLCLSQNNKTLGCVQLQPQFFNFDEANKIIKLTSTTDNVIKIQCKDSKEFSEKKSILTDLLYKVTSKEFIEINDIYDQIIIKRDQQIIRRFNFEDLKCKLEDSLLHFVRDDRIIYTVKINQQIGQQIVQELEKRGVKSL